MIPDWADPVLSAELPRLAAMGETQDVEFKREMPKHLGDLAKEIAAFATSNAGTILLGIEDGGEIVGLADGVDESARRALRTRLEGVFNQVRPSVTPTLRFALFDGMVVVAIDVPKGTQPIYYAASIPYHRQITAARPLAPEDVIERVLEWQAARGGKASPESEFLGTLAGFWPQVDLLLCERRKRKIKPWSDTLRWTAGIYADRARQLGANAPHELEALIEPLEQLADALTAITSERPALGRPDAEVIAAQQEAERILTEVRARYLSPSRFSDRAARTQRSAVEAEARRLEGLAKRIDADPRGMSLTTVQSEAAERGEALFLAASLGVGMGGDAQRDELRAIAEALRDVETMRVTMDGGRSVQRIHDATRDANRRLQDWIGASGE